jgi:hypothetical protein
MLIEHYTNVSDLSFFPEKTTTRPVWGYVAAAGIRKQRITRLWVQVLQLSKILKFCVQTD